MDSNILYEKLEMLPEHLKREALDFVDFLLEKSFRQGKEIARKPLFGSAKGKIHMADDFDEPLEDFKDYM